MQRQLDTKRLFTTLL